MKERKRSHIINLRMLVPCQGLALIQFFFGLKVWNNIRKGEERVLRQTDKEIAILLRGEEGGAHTNTI